MIKVKLICQHQLKIAFTLKPLHEKHTLKNAIYLDSIPLLGQPVIDGDHHHLGHITDTIIRDRQVKYIFQIGDVKECLSFDR